MKVQQAILSRTYYKSSHVNYYGKSFIQTYHRLAALMRMRQVDLPRDNEPKLVVSMSTLYLPNEKCLEFAIYGGFPVNWVKSLLTLKNDSKL